jgi:hypothetical protein
VSQKVTVITVDTVVDEERDMTPTLDLRITPVTTPAGSTAVLTWESKNVDTCTAGGSWSGSKPRMGTETTARLIETGNHQFSVTCTTDTGATVTKQVSVLVTGQIPPPEKTDIRVVMNDNVNVRATPGGAKVGMQVKGAMGTQSPAPAVVSGGYSWAYINFDAGSDGYVATAYITPVATTELTEDQKKSEIRKLLRELERLQVMLLALLAQQE